MPARGLGYAWLSDAEVFPFLELRAAAVRCAGASISRGAPGPRRVRAPIYNKGRLLVCGQCAVRR